MDPYDANPHLNMTPLIIRELCEVRAEIGSRMISDFLVLSAFISPLRNIFGSLQMSVGKHDSLYGE